MCCRANMAAGRWRLLVRRAKIRMFDHRLEADDTNSVILREQGETDSLSTDTRGRHISLARSSIY